MDQAPSQRRGSARLLLGLAAGLVLLIAPCAAQDKNRLPEEVLNALRAADKAILYSLEPWERPTPQSRTLHRYAVLGQAELDRSQTAAAAAEFEAVVSRWDGALAACFDPRHAMSVVSAGATYDLLLCYECQQLRVYKDGRMIAGLGATGSAKALDTMLVALRLPLSPSGQRIRSERQAGARR